MVCDEERVAGFFLESSRVLVVECCSTARGAYLSGIFSDVNFGVVASGSAWVVWMADRLAISTELRGRLRRVVVGFCNSAGGTYLSECRFLRRKILERSHEFPDQCGSSGWPIGLLFLQTCTDAFRTAGLQTCIRVLVVAWCGNLGGAFLSNTFPDVNFGMLAHVFGFA